MKASISYNWSFFPQFGNPCFNVLPNCRPRWELIHNYLFHKCSFYQRCVNSCNLTCLNFLSGAVCLKIFCSCSGVWNSEGGLWNRSAHLSSPNENSVSFVTNVLMREVPVCLWETRCSSSPVGRSFVMLFEHREVDRYYHCRTLEKGFSRGCSQ